MRAQKVIGTVAVLIALLSLLVVPAHAATIDCSLMHWPTKIGTGLLWEYWGNASASCSATTNMTVRVRLVISDGNPATGTQVDASSNTCYDIGCSVQTPIHLAPAGNWVHTQGALTWLDSDGTLKDISTGNYNCIQL